MERKPRIGIPTTEEIKAILAPSDEFELADIRKPVYDFLIGRLKTDEAVSDWINDRITAIAVRLNKSHDNREFVVTKEQRSSAQRARWANWREERGREKGVFYKPDTVRVRATGEAHASFVRLSPRRKDRPAFAAECLARMMDAFVSSGSHDALAKWSSEHTTSTFTDFITLETATCDLAKEIAHGENVPFTKLVSYLLENR